MKDKTIEAQFRGVWIQARVREISCREYKMEGLSLGCNNRLRLQSCLIVPDSKKLRIKFSDEVHKLGYSVYPRETKMDHDLKYEFGRRR